METTESLNRYTLCEVAKPEAKAFIVERHYSHNWGSNFGIHNYGLRDGDELVACAAYGHLMNPTSYNKISRGMHAEQVVELNRLWVHDDLGRNAETWLMAAAHRRLLADTPVRLVQSFADGRLGVGTVYQSASFGYYGKSETLFHVNRVDGITYHSTPFSNTAHIGIARRNAMFARGELDTMMVSTYRYLKPLTAAVARRITLKPLPYPKERDGGVRQIPNYVPPLGQCVRGYLIGLIDDDPCAADLAPYVRKRGMGEDDLQRAITNRWVYERAAKYGVRVDDLLRAARAGQTNVRRAA